ncbi:hypothetical protein [Candidatus Phytoplasma solani]|uniref:Uncharacterized protein n=1 Tax=Candidatus Phytoplasma solani TaxID=69896 RepID=A0A421NV98_9MOLU|nr:hypothetical protein [Candidatus Phytoplasma solani]RMI87556.1 hypothetical protein PSSA1_v1c7340 [Candidatus Phytoplasma solani]RMI87557.1 hypothetical protein PSSA1_v1c7200 [Candidatus Phytoplasma solani]RMI87596.1 hypothetical protein PSSA1_v1c6850 [Candidatus Phytoplasma solani]RMI87612.1 hypothetical protein PSSA1_v1c6680 [Candidatus Phytoplasma solani]RMI87625.1 hypothetical protein PSSA1_v1c6830 [Candidatus Phytoplasma solani]
MNLKPRNILIILTLTYIGFIITNLMTLFFDFNLGIKANTTISLFSDIVFLIYIWLKEQRKNEN